MNSKEIMDKIVELLKHMINLLLISCIRDNSCSSSCCVKNEEINIFDNNIEKKQKNE
jgi:hypothetical protein